MEDRIKNEYNIEVSDLIKKDHYYMFSIDDNYFYLTEVRRSKEEFDELIVLYEELKEKGYPVHTIVRTVNNGFYILVDEKVYVLTVVNKPMEEYSLIEMLKFNDILKLNKKNILVRDNWAILWSEKLDYFEYQIRELGKDKKVVLNTFSYFDGLCENAISYVNKVFNTIKGNTLLVLSRRRVWYPNYHLNYDNPLQFIFDLEVRDIAEYIKGMAMDDVELALIDLKSYLDLRKLDLYSLGMLYGRLMYPSYYFDLYENVMNFDESEDCLLKVIDKVPQIELFLKKSYELIVKYGPIEPVEWIMKNEYIEN